MVLYLALTWSATGYFGPSLFLGLLMFLAAQDLENRKVDREFIYQSFIRPEPSKFWAQLFIVIFWLGLAAAHFHFPGRHFLLPISSILTPHPIAASEQCDQATYAVYKNRLEKIEVPEKAGRPETMHCNPYLRFLDLKSLCQHFSSAPEFQTISSFLNVRRMRDTHFQKAFEVRDFCNPSLTYKSLGLSTWTTSSGE